MEKEIDTLSRYKRKIENTNNRLESELEETKKLMASRDQVSGAFFTPLSSSNIATQLFGRTDDIFERMGRGSIISRARLAFPFVYLKNAKTIAPVLQVSADVVRIKGTRFSYFSHCWETFIANDGAYRDTKFSLLFSFWIRKGANN